MRWYQFSLRSLLIFITFFAIACSWFVIKMQEAKKQQSDIEQIDQLGGNAYYSFQCDETGEPIHDSVIFHPDGKMQVIRCPEASTPRWLRNILSDDFFYNIVSIELFDLESLDKLEKLETCKKLKLIHFRASPTEPLEDAKITKKLRLAFPQSKITTVRVIERNVRPSGS